MNHQVWMIRLCWRGVLVAEMILGWWLRVLWCVVCRMSCDSVRGNMTEAGKQTMKRVPSYKQWKQSVGRVRLRLLMCFRTSLPKY